MLQQMRSMKMYVFWFVAITFLLGFVFFGGLDIDQFGRGSRAIGVINGSEISYETYNRYVQQLADVQRSRFNRDELLPADYEQIEVEAWDAIVSEMLVSQQARKLGIRVPDEDIINILSSSSPPPFIQQRFLDDKGQFDAAAYQRAVNDPSYDWAQDEAYLRARLPSLKLQQMVRAQAVVSEQEVRLEFAHRNQRSKVRYVGVPWSSIDLGAWVPSDDQLRSYYDQHKRRYLRPEAVSLEIIRIDKKPSAMDLEDSMDDARQILEDLKRGETFASLAEASSDDPSADRGGDIGWVTQAQLPPMVGLAAAGLDAGGTSDIVPVGDDLYVVHADSVRTTPSGREVRLRQVVLHTKPSTETLDSVRTRVVELAPKAKKDFQGTARALGATVQKLDSVERVGILPGIGLSRRLVDWAFEAKPGQVSEPVGIDNAILIARLVEKRTDEPLPFEQAREQVRTALLQEQIKERAHQRLEKVLAQVHSGAPLDLAARAEGLQGLEPPPFNFYEPVASVGSRNEFSAVASTLDAGKTSGIVDTQDGSYIVQVVSRDPLDEAAYQQARAGLYQDLQSRREAEVYQVWLKDLREHADIKDQRAPGV